MKSDPRIDTYITQAAPFAQPILRRLRQLVHEFCPESEETRRKRLATTLEWLAESKPRNWKHMNC